MLGNRASADQPCLLNHILISEKSVGVLHSLEFFYYFMFISYQTSIIVIGRMVLEFYENIVYKIGNNHKINESNTFLIYEREHLPIVGFMGIYGL